MASRIMDRYNDQAYCPGEELLSPESKDGEPDIPAMVEHGIKNR